MPSPPQNKSDIIIFASGIDNSVESEDKDRVSIAWTGEQLDLIGELAAYRKPMIVLQMGGGQMDSSPIANNLNVSALLWGGYPGQDGGLAIMDILTGKKAPAGRLAQTQYPADYITQVPMTNMSLRPGLNNPGRTYKWYTGKPIFDFGYGLHYTNFSASINPLEATTFNISSLIAGCTEKYMDRCPFRSLFVKVTTPAKPRLPITRPSVSSPALSAQSRTPRNPSSRISVYLTSPWALRPRPCSTLRLAA
jgi:beta-D-xylosidase 4